MKEYQKNVEFKVCSSDILGFVNFYRHFIKNFCYTAKPLNKLKGKKEQKQKEEYQKAFKELKKKITS